MRLRLFTIALLALQLCHVAHADDILYTIVGINGYSQNVDITYLSESGFLDFSSEHLIPTTTSDLTWKGMDLGLVTNIVFYNSDLMELYANPVSLSAYGGPYSEYPKSLAMPPSQSPISEAAPHRNHQVSCSFAPD